MALQTIKGTENPKNLRSLILGKVRYETFLLETFWLEEPSASPEPFCSCVSQWAGKIHFIKESVDMLGGIQQVFFFFLSYKSFTL